MTVTFKFSFQKEMNQTELEKQLNNLGIIFISIALTVVVDVCGKLPSLIKRINEKINENFVVLPNQIERLRLIRSFLTKMNKSN